MKNLILSACESTEGFAVQLMQTRSAGHLIVHWTPWSTRDMWGHGEPSEPWTPEQVHLNVYGQLLMEVGDELLAANNDAKPPPDTATSTKSTAAPTFLIGQTVQVQVANAPDHGTGLLGTQTGDILEVEQVHGESWLLARTTKGQCGYVHQTKVSPAPATTTQQHPARGAGGSGNTSGKAAAAQQQSSSVQPPPQQRHGENLHQNGSSLPTPPPAPPQHQQHPRQQQPQRSDGGPVSLPPQQQGAQHASSSGQQHGAGSPQPNGGSRTAPPPLPPHWWQSRKQPKAAQSTHAPFSTAAQDTSTHPAAPCVQQKPQRPPTQATVAGQAVRVAAAAQQCKRQQILGTQVGQILVVTNVHDAMWLSARAGDGQWGHVRRAQVEPAEIPTQPTPPKRQRTLPETRGDQQTGHRHTLQGFMQIYGGDMHHPPLQWHNAPATEVRLHLPTGLWYDESTFRQWCLPTNAPSTVPCDKWSTAPRHMQTGKKQNSG
jgi:hypothetical protein